MRQSQQPKKSDAATDEATAFRTAAAGMRKTADAMTALAPMIISAASGNNITISYTVAGGTPNDFFTTLIERLA